MTALPRPLLIRVVAVALVLVAVVVPLGGLFGFGPLSNLAGANQNLGAGQSGSPRAGASSVPVAPASPSAAPTATAAPLPSPTPTPSPTPIPPVAFVPVASYRSVLETVDGPDIDAVLRGKSSQFTSLELVAADAQAMLAVLKRSLTVDPVTAPPARIILAPDAATVTADLAAHRDRLAFLRAEDVTPAVRALGFGESAYFGVGRLQDPGKWPFSAPLTPAGGPAYDPAAAWTLLAGGDILLDRGIALTVKTQGKGVDFPFSGGSASITSRYCCSSFGWKLPKIARTGNAGALRRLVSGADLAIANFENPAPVKFTWHEHGTVFTADPALIAGLRNAGIDWVSLANNHIRDAGANGILQTITALNGYGIAHGGAGAGYDAAHAATMLAARGVKVAILGYDTIAPSYWTRNGTTVGSAQMTVDTVKADVATARAAGAQLVIVFPHWGVEYTTKVTAQQSTLAHAAIDAGADLVIGNHPHWAGAVELYKGKPIWYALGNFVFDQTWSEPTMEGITLELTFNGSSLVQAVMRPHIILDRSQPNLMDPAAAGKVVMDQVFGASRALPW